MTRGIWALFAATFALGAACGGSVSSDQDPGSTGGTAGLGNGGTSAGNTDCAVLSENECASENNCVVVWRNDQIVEMAGLPPPSTGTPTNDPCCIGCQEQECVNCHQPRFVGCQLRSSACSQTETELCGYLEQDACAAD